MSFSIFNTKFHVLSISNVLTNENLILCINENKIIILSFFEIILNDI